jgi:conjugal transfer pilin signal peptidase TrbI
MEGDQLSYNHSGNLQIQILDVSSRWLGRSFIISKSKTHSKDGRILTPIRPGFVPKGLVFVRGDHERSFDSRYEELGLIHEKDLQGRLIALV